MAPRWEPRRSADCSELVTNLGPSAVSVNSTVYRLLFALAKCGKSNTVRSAGKGLGGSEVETSARAYRVRVRTEVLERA